MNIFANLTFVTALCTVTAASAYAQDGTVYTQSNSVAGNALISFTRNANGTLTRSLTYPTGGLGTGAGLGSGSISVSRDGDSIIVANAGSNSITLFHREDGVLVFQDVEPSNGINPISITQSGRFVYVLNQGTSTIPGNVQEFVNYEGRLVAVNGALWTLATAGAGAQQVGFTKNGDGLVVTEVNTNLIDTLQLDYFARPLSVNSQPSTGVGPFGFALDPKGRLFVTNASGGVANAGTVTSYNLPQSLVLNPISSSVPTHYTAPCWDAVSPAGTFLFVSDAHSGVITGFHITKTGSLTPVMTDGLSANPGGATLDLSFSPNGQYLYVVVGGSNPRIVEYKSWNNGILTQIGSVSIPAGSAGLASE